ncbi:hypothetical protein CC86DRAFT_414425 [Ophiobolus disseminans]|uniref:Uncharacterized protein n=1 Tax=Ophiobolus disseminans TaxID=1469910 RepID=A0A6A7AHN9_9PLEO|nr:hypothetical protein CC86DRAFT_414425 [Ophiobolus disseminans]
MSGHSNEHIYSLKRILNPSTQYSYPSNTPPISCPCNTPRPSHSRATITPILPKTTTPPSLPHPHPTMCHYTLTLCPTCHTLISRRPTNCGKGLAILGPSGLTIECPDYTTSAIPQVINETQECETCIREAVYDGRRASRWDEFLGWRRKREGEWDL